MTPEPEPEPVGRVTVVGLGPGGPATCTPEALAALRRATDVVGYGPYVAMADALLSTARAPDGGDGGGTGANAGTGGDDTGRHGGHNDGNDGSGNTGNAGPGDDRRDHGGNAGTDDDHGDGDGEPAVRHVSDNRQEADRARHALDLAAAGGRVVVVSSGDPGVFAMATAVVEQLDVTPGAAARWAGVEVDVLPGVSAAQAAAARAGAPLGHDFCVVSLSDNLKPWATVERRLEAAAAADFVIALYNPVSRQRPWQLARAAELLAAHRAPATPVVLGRDVGRPAESVRLVTLADLATAGVDMRTVVIVGSSTTRVAATPTGRRLAYTPRHYPAPEPDPAPATTPQA